MKKMSVFSVLILILLPARVFAQPDFGQYPFPDKLNEMSNEDVTKIKTTLAACADLMSFDIKNYDYDTIFKYVLFSHENFRILTDLDPMSGSSSNLGYNNVSLVSSTFIDYIMEHVLCVPPKKPPVNELLSRGFCYSNGYYYYNVSFDVFFSTVINNLTNVYDLGGKTLYVVFSDTYTEGDIKTPEYSFAVLQENGDSYSLLRLGMGEDFPSADEVLSYAPRDIENEDGDTKIPVRESAFIPLLLVVIALGVLGFIRAVILFIRIK